MKKNRCSIRTLKIYLSIFNVIFWFAGVGFLGLGIWFYLAVREFRAAVDHAQYLLPAFLLIISGGAVVVFGVIGCIAIFSESRCLLLFYWLCIIAVLAADVATCVKSFQLDSEVESHVRYKLNATIRYHYMYDTDSTEAVDGLQKKFSCCGVLNYTDWRYTENTVRGIRTVPNDKQTYPVSCCKDEKQCNNLMLNFQQNIRSRGCHNLVVDKMRFMLYLVSWSTLAISAYLIIESFMVCCLYVGVAR